jgi:hypothetical protein
MGGSRTGVQYKNFVWNSERWDGFELRPDDIVISTPPKCGTTWMQMQCALLLFRTPDLPAPLAKLSPWLDMNTRPKEQVWAELAAQTHRRFIKTHTLLDGLPWDDRVTYVHVARDPRDAGLSWDNHVANVDIARLFELRVAAVGMDDFAELGIGEPPAPLDDPVDRFWQWVEGDGDGMAMFESLVRHAASFWAARDRPNVHLFHYRDQRDDLASQMTRLAEALGVEPPTPELVEAARFEEMKSRADELVPNSDMLFWLSNDRFFDQGRHEAWTPLMTGDGAARYEAALRRITDDEAFIAWLHRGGTE